MRMSKGIIGSLSINLYCSVFEYSGYLVFLKD